MKNLNLNLDKTLSSNSNIVLSSQRALKSYIDDKRILLDFLQDTAPTTYTTGNKWLNTSNFKLYIATSNSAWDSGTNITTGQIFSYDNLLYYYDGSNLLVYSTKSIVDVNSGDETKIWIGTQNEYDNLDSYDPNTIYNITDNSQTLSTLLATQQEFNNSAQNKAATPYQVNQALGNYMPLAGGNFDIGAVVRFTNGNGTNSISYDNSNVLNITNNVSVGNNLTANNIVATSGNIYKINTSGANVIWSSDKGVANGLATLDSNTKVPTTQLPLATNSTVGVVKGDGTTTSIDAGGVISVIGGGGGGQSDFYPPLLSYIPSDHILNDIQWLRSDTFSWQSGAVYEGAYNELESEYNNIDSEEKIDIISTNSWTQPSSVSTTLGGNDFAVYTDITTFDEYHGIENAFNTSATNPFETTSSFTSGNFIIYNPLPICITALAFTNVNATNYSARQGTIYGSNDNINWIEIYNYDNTNGTANATWSISFSNSNYYKYYKVTCDYTVGAILPGGTGYWAIAHCAITATVVDTYIIYKKTPRGYEIATSDQEQNIARIYNQTGISWYYILDTVNERFKLPRNNNIIHGELVKSVRSGNSWYRIYEDGWCEQGDVVPRTTNAAQTIIFPIPFKDTTYTLVQNYQAGTSNGNTGENENGYYNKTTTGFTNKSTVALTYINEFSYIATGFIDVPSSQIDQRKKQYKYLYFFVGGYSQEAIVQTAGITSEQLNEKVDVSNMEEIKCVVETYNSGTQWYRLWSDGWCEQGGYVASVGTGSGTSTVTFLKSFIDSNYVLTFGTFGNGYNSGEANFRCTAYTNTTVTFYNNSGTATTYKWYACGYVN